MTIVQTIFLSKLRREAEHWAEAWGFLRGQWVWVGALPQTRGIRYHPDLDGPVFVCGSQRIERDLVESLEVAGFTTFIDAHDLDTFHESRSALDLLEVERLEG